MSVLKETLIKIGFNDDEASIILEKMPDLDQQNYAEFSLQELALKAGNLRNQYLKKTNTLKPKLAIPTDDDNENTNTMVFKRSSLPDTAVDAGTASTGIYPKESLQTPSPGLSKPGAGLSRPGAGLNRPGTNILENNIAPAKPVGLSKPGSAINKLGSSTPPPVDKNSNMGVPTMTFNRGQIPNSAQEATFANKSSTPNNELSKNSDQGLNSKFKLKTSTSSLKKPSISNTDQVLDSANSNTMTMSNSDVLGQAVDVSSTISSKKPGSSLDNIATKVDIKPQVEVPKTKVDFPSSEQLNISPPPSGSKPKLSLKGGNKGMITPPGRGLEMPKPGNATKAPGLSLKGTSNIETKVDLPSSGLTPPSAGLTPPSSSGLKAPGNLSAPGKLVPPSGLTPPGELSPPGALNPPQNNQSESLDKSPSDDLQAPPPPPPLSLKPGSHVNAPTHDEGHDKKLDLSTPKESNEDINQEASETVTTSLTKIQRKRSTKKKKPILIIAACGVLFLGGIVYLAMSLLNDSDDELDTMEVVEKPNKELKTDQKSEPNEPNLEVKDESINIPSNSGEWAFQASTPLIFNLNKELDNDWTLESWINIPEQNEVGTVRVINFDSDENNTSLSLRVFKDHYCDIKFADNKTKSTKALRFGSTQYHIAITYSEKHAVLHINGSYIGKIPADFKLSTIRLGNEKLPIVFDELLLVRSAIYNSEENFTPMRSPEPGDETILYVPFEASKTTDQLDFYVENNQSQMLIKPDSWRNIKQSVIDIESLLDELNLELGEVSTPR